MIKETYILRHALRILLLKYDNIVINIVPDEIHTFYLFLVHSDGICFFNLIDKPVRRVVGIC